MNLGEWNTLRLDRFTTVGAYLVDDEGNDVLLPNKYVRDEYEEDQELLVFIYKDSEDRIVATTRQPYVELNQFAFLKVLEVNAFGAFLDWGLEKDLIVPFREQPKNMEEGRYYMIYLFLDEPTQRLAATARIQPFYQDAQPDAYEKNQAVSLLICEHTELGCKVIVDHKYKGLIFHSDLQRKLRMGERTTGYVKNVRADGKLDILLHPEGYEKVGPIARKILQILEQNGGYLPLNDKSSPEDIQAVTGLSKKTFKQVIGSLYKDRSIVIHDNGIALVATED